MINIFNDIVSDPEVKELFITLFWEKYELSEKLPEDYVNEKVHKTLELHQACPQWLINLIASVQCSILFSCRCNKCIQDAESITRAMIFLYHVIKHVEDKIDVNELEKMMLAKDPEKL